MTVLGSGDSGWHVPGRDSGVVPLVFRQDHTAGKIRRIFRLDGHMWKRRILGTTVISLISQVTGKANIGVGAISVFFVLGMIVFRMATAEEKGEGKKVRMRFGEDGVS